MQILNASLYDFPKYYDLVYGSDWQAEFDFLRQCFARHAERPVKRVFEPACGTGRLLIKLAQAGYQVGGNDLNSKAVEFCNARLVRHGFEPTALIGDMADFRLRPPVGAAFNLINSFRHLGSEVAAESHLRCVAESLAPGGLYVLGLHLTPAGPPLCQEESWSGRRGHLAVTCRVWTMGLDRRRRVEQVGTAYDVYTPTRHLRIEDQTAFRTYTAGQFRRLLASVPELQVVETYDFAYNIQRPVKVRAHTEDVVYVLRRAW